MVEINRSEEFRRHNGVTYDMDLILEPISHPQLSELAVVRHAALQRIVHHIDTDAQPVPGDVAITRLEAGCRVVPASAGTIRHIQGVLGDYSDRTYQADRLPENQRFVEPRRQRAREIAQDMGIALKALETFDDLRIMPQELAPYYPGSSIFS